MTQHEPPLHRFLGMVDPSQGPFGVLGLEVGDYSGREINEAIRARMLQVDRHPQRDSMEADEVRLAIHVAAAQLVDPTVRRALIDRLREVPTDGDRGEVRRQPVDGALLSTLVLQTVARSGGWNASAKQRLAALAHVHGLAPASMSDALMRMAPTTPKAARVPSMPDIDGEEDSEPSERPLVIASLALIVVSVVFAVVLGVMLVDRFGGGGNAGAQAESEMTSDGGVGSERVGSSVVAEQSSEPVLSEGEGRRIVELLREARESPESGEELARTIVECTAAAERSWAQLDEGAIATLPLEFAETLGVLRAIDVSLALETLRRIGEPIAGERWAASTTDGREWLSGIWATGLLARMGGLGLANELESERAQILGRAYPGVAGSLPRSFEEGVRLAMLQGLASQIAVIYGSDESGADSWSGWLDAVTRVGSWDREMSQRVMLEAASRLLRMDPGPSDVPAGMAALGSLVERIDFTTDEHGAQTWLVGWFDDSMIPSDELSLLTMRLHTQGLVAGLEMELVLGAGATPSDRMLLRDAYARRFGLAQSARMDVFLVRWLESCDEVDRAMGGTDAGDALARSVVYATLNAAAALYWEGDRERAQDLLVEADRAMQELAELSFTPRPDIDARRFTARTLLPDGEWAASYLSMRNPEEHMNLLASLRAMGGPMGPADADVLADAALRGSHLARRRLAQDVLMAFSQDPQVLNSVLESMSSNLARQPDVNEMLETITGETLPDLDDASWSLAARRAVAVKLLEILSADRFAVMDGLRERLHGAYAVLADGMNVLLDDGEDPIAGVGRDLTSIAWGVHGVWMQEARRIIGGSWAPQTYSEMQSRARSRRSTDDGVIAEFVAAQSTLCETLGYLVSAERRERAKVVAELLADAQSERIGANHVFEQIEILERTIQRLWAIRLERAQEGEGI